MAQELDNDGEDMFMSEVMDLNESNDDNNEMPFGLNSLLKEPLIRLKANSDLSHGSQTPRNPYNDRKRKNPTRRCLSEVLDNHSEHNLSPTFLQCEQSRDISIDDQKWSPTLTPIFTKIRGEESAENLENDSFVANASMTSITSPMFSLEDMNPIKRPQKMSRRSNSMISPSLKKTPPFIRCHSASEAVIMEAVQMSCADPSLIGDFSKSYALPLIHGKHQDLKSISVDVLAQVLEGHYESIIAECTVVDCRYPYEFNGGHIRGATNVYSQEAILQEFIKNRATNEPPKQQNTNKRNILVFHCEFSSERGPTLSRFLRNNDRSTNKDFYPQLHHPEVYLLEGGYKAFFERYSNLCEPPEYLPMHSKDHEHELRRFRAIVKSLSTDGKCFGSVFKSSSNRGHV